VGFGMKLHLLLIALASLTFTIPVFAQSMDRTMPDMEGMEMKGPPTDAQLGGEMQTADPPVGTAPAPDAPIDHAADRFYPAQEMAVARAELEGEHGGQTFSQIMLNLNEIGVFNGKTGYRWDDEAWFGGDLNQLVLKSEGEGAFHDGLDHAEVQTLYSRAIDPYWNLQAGFRQDFKPNPSRTYATVGFEGLAPRWFELSGALFLSNKGDVLGRFEASYDQQITQRLTLQPRAELNFAAQNVPEDQTGSGLSDAELGLRLRYEITRELALYIGVANDRNVGNTARFTRLKGDDPRSTSVVFGMKSWF
jgi:copper resistance protein B